MVVLGRRAPAPDPAATPLRMEAVPSRACAADRGGWACGFGRQEVPTGGVFLAGPDKPGGATDRTCGGCRGGGFRGARHSGGFVLRACEIGVPRRWVGR